MDYYVFSLLCECINKIVILLALTKYKFLKWDYLLGIYSKL